MSTSVLTFGDIEYDNPWRRLYWTVPAAIAIWFTIIWLFTVFMGAANDRLPEPSAIDAQIVQMSEPFKAVTTSPTKQTQPKLASLPPAITQPSFEKAPPPNSDTKQVNETNLPKQETPQTHAESTTAISNANPYVSAKAISQPIPQIPEELRQDALSTSAVARFHVEAAGTITVELVKPTANIKLNRLLLSSLKNWRFFPAMKDGKPVASTEEIVIKIEVR